MNRKARSEGPASARHRILFVTHTSEWIGPNISLLELVTRLPASLNPLVAVPGSGRFTDVLSSRGVPFQTYKRLDKFGIPALVRTIRSQGVSVVYGNSAHGTSRNALIAAKFCRVPFVYHLREMAGGRQLRRNRLFAWADAGVAVSSATARSYRGRFRVPVRVIHNGVSLEAFELDRKQSREEVAAELGLDERVPIVIHVGNVYGRKGTHTAIDAFRQLRESVPECCLLVVGRTDRDREYVATLEARIVEEGLEGKVFIMGLRTDIQKLLAAADVFLHTAVEDPHPRAVIEAMAAQLPVVALSVDGVAETVVDGETGFLIPPPGTALTLADPIARLLLHPELRLRMGQNARERVKTKFSADRTARKVADLILELAEPR